MFIYNRKAQYHETDKMGIVHHANYVKWMEEARVEFMEYLGLGYKTVEAKGIVSPVTRVALEYKKPVQFADEVAIKVAVQKYSGVVLEVQYEMFNITQNEICTLASSQHCFIKDERIISLKKEMPELNARISAELATGMQQPKP